MLTRTFDKKRAGGKTPIVSICHWTFQEAERRSTHINYENYVGTPVSQDEAKKRMGRGGRNDLRWENGVEMCESRVPAIMIHYFLV